MQFIKKFIILVLPLFLLWSLMLYIAHGSISLNDVKTFNWFGTIETMEFTNMLDKFENVISIIKNNFYSSLHLIRAEVLSISNANNILSVLKSIGRIWYNIFDIFTLPTVLFVNVILLGWNFTTNLLFNLWQIFKFFYAPLF